MSVEAIIPKPKEHNTLSEQELSAAAAPGEPPADETSELPPASSHDAAAEPSTAMQPLPEGKDEEETSGDEPVKEKLATEPAAEKLATEPAVEEDDYADIWQTHETVHRVIVEPIEHRVRLVQGDGEFLRQLATNLDDGSGGSDRDRKAEAKAERKRRRAQDREDQKIVDLAIEEEVAEAEAWSRIQQDASETGQAEPDFEAWSWARELAWREAQPAAVYDHADDPEVYPAQPAEEEEEEEWPDHATEAVEHSWTDQATEEWTEETS